MSQSKATTCHNTAFRLGKLPLADNLLVNAIIDLVNYGSKSIDENISSLLY